MAEEVKQIADRFTVLRTTGTHGDIFAAVGLADLLSTIPESGEIRIKETATGFDICASNLSHLDGVPAVPGYPFLKANEKIQIPKEVIDAVDYKAEKNKADRRRKLLQNEARRSAGSEIEQLLKHDELRPDWRLLQVLNVVGAYKTSNRVHSLISGMKPVEFSRTVRNALERLVAFEPSGVDWPAKSVQLFTPNAAKGYCRLKPDSTDRNDKTKEQWTDPFVEWLRYRGYFVVACSFLSGDDVRLLCPVPHDISIDALRQAAVAIRQMRIPRSAPNVFPSAPKIDSFAALTLADLLIRRSEEYHDADTPPFLGNKLFGKTPSDVISGISVTHYQSLGNAKAVSAISTIALPGWLVLNQPQDATTFLEILDEHQRIVRSLRDDHSDEIGFLLEYRRFLQARGEDSIRVLVDFMSRYGALVLRAREQNRRIPQFTTTNFERLLMQNTSRLSLVLGDPGFRAVASAIRNATVSAQAQKAMKHEYRDIRYGLIPELHRKSSLPGNDPFVQVLAQFISTYNIENARRRELGKPAPRNVTTDEFEALVSLIETNGAVTIGPMLCAYGSCRVPKEVEPSNATEAETAEAKQE